MAIPVSALQSINPGSVIELFTIELITALHGANTLYRFHNGANLNANGEVVWAGNSYLRFPIECNGFEFGSTGTLPRPTISISNIFGTITTIIQTVNETTVGNDLNGAKFTRVRTLARYLDAANFTGGTNPFGAPDPTAEFPQEIYFLDRKVTETRDIVTWEAQSALDLVNVKLPQRIATKDIFPGIGAFLGF